MSLVFTGFLFVVATLSAFHLFFLLVFFALFVCFILFLNICMLFSLGHIIVQTYKFTLNLSFQQ